MSNAFEAPGDLEEKTMTVTEGAADPYAFTAEFEEDAGP